MLFPYLIVHGQDGSFTWACSPNHAFCLDTMALANIWKILEESTHLNQVAKFATATQAGESSRHFPVRSLVHGL